MKRHFQPFVFFLVFLFTSTAYGMLQCSFEDRTLELSPGERGQLEIEVLNPDTQPLAIRAYIGDWLRTEAGEQQFHPPGTVANSAAGQLRLAESLIILEPGEEGKFQLSATVPPEQEGSRTAMVFVEAERPPQTESGSAEMQIKFQISLRYGIKIYLVARGTQQPRSRFLELSLEPQQAGKLPVTLAVENTGNLHLKYRGQLEVRDFTGKVLEVVELPPFSILPGAKLKLESQIEPPPVGEYLLLALVDYGSKTMAAEAQFMVKGGGDS